MDALNYVLFKNPLSSTVIQGTNSALAYCVRLSTGLFVFARK